MAMHQQFVATFVPQAWVNDYAIDVDPEGPTEWDATVAFQQLPWQYRERLEAAMNARGSALDADDRLQTDPRAPEWVRAWSGPFSLYVRMEYVDERLFTSARRDQGFRSQAHLDAWYRYSDHVRSCEECQRPGEPMWLEGDASWQPTHRSCAEADRLFAEERAENFAMEEPVGV